VEIGFDLDGRVLASGAYTPVGIGAPSAPYAHGGPYRLRTLKPPRDRRRDEQGTERALS
jgi:hypothetical protein